MVLGRKIKLTQKHTVEDVNACLHQPGREGAFEIILDAARSRDGRSEFQHHEDSTGGDYGTDYPAHERHSYAPRQLKDCAWGGEYPICDIESVT